MLYLLDDIIPKLPPCIYEGDNMVNGPQSRINSPDRSLENPANGVKLLSFTTQLCNRVHSAMILVNFFWYVAYEILHLNTVIFFFENGPLK